MARRNKTMLEDVFDMCAEAPWGFGVAAAALFAVIGLILMARMTHNAVEVALRPLAGLLFGVFTVVSLAASAVSAIKGLSRRQLLDRQKGLDSVLSLSWREFEHLVGEAYRRQGYDVEETGGGGADGGIDLVLRGHGETVLVQCKQWRDRQVGVEKVRELFGVVTAERADRGILVTSGNFTNEAQAFKVGKPLTLVDGPALEQLVRDVQAPRTASVPTPPPAPATSTTCPRCGSPMVLRTAKRGASAGNSFYGCTKYPACKGTRPAD